MATKKAGGSAKNLRDSNPKYLGVKRADGQTVKQGEIIVRQRGTKIKPGKNVSTGVDHTLYAAKAGRVSFRNTQLLRFDGQTLKKKIVDVLTKATTK